MCSHTHFHHLLGPDLRHPDTPQSRDLWTGPVNVAASMNKLARLSLKRRNTWWPIVAVVATCSGDKEWMKYRVFQGRFSYGALSIGLVISKSALGRSLDPRALS